MLNGCTSLFRKKRKLLQRLKKCCLRRQRQCRRCGSDDQPTTSSSSDRSSLAATEVIFDFLKQLNCDQLQLLLRAVESHGRDSHDCIAVSRRDDAMVATEAVLVDACYRQYRCCCDAAVAGIDIANDLRHLPPPGRPIECDMVENNCFCLNPYHYFICVPQPRLSFRGHSDVSNECCISLPSTSTTTDTGFCTAGTSTSGKLEELSNSHDSSSVPRKDCSVWCTIAYWECDSRVGRLTSVAKPSVSVTTNDAIESPSTCVIRLERFWDVGDSTTTPCSTTVRCRQAIGLGLQMFRGEDGDIWLYNRSQLPLFFNSSSLANVADVPDDDVAHPAQPAVRRLSSGRSVQIHRENDCRAPSPSIAADSSSRYLVTPVGDPPPSLSYSGTSFGEDATARTIGQRRPTDPPSTVSISFGKGWGATYKRSFNTCCPSWIEVIFAR